MCKSVTTSESSHDENFRYCYMYQCVNLLPPAKVHMMKTSGAFIYVSMCKSVNTCQSSHDESFRYCNMYQCVNLLPPVKVHMMKTSGTIICINV